MSTIPYKELDPSLMAELETARWPRRMSAELFYPLAYRMMHYARRMETRLVELFQKGYVKGTVTMSMGNEATAIGIGLPMRPGLDPVSLLHRDFVSHLLLGAQPYDLACQYMANAKSPTHGREGNCHHGDAARRRFPMISHLGNMLAPVVGATWAARQNNEPALGVAVIGDGGSSTGDFHESINLASVLRSPVLFLVENNYYSFSTPITHQYHCRQLSDRAAGYGITGLTIDGTDPWLVYNTVCDLFDQMHEDRLPTILECSTVRLHGHAAYDKNEYVTKEQMDGYRLRDPLPKTRQEILRRDLMSEEEIASLEQEIDEEIRGVVARALEVGRPDPQRHVWSAYAESTPPALPPYRAAKVKNGDGIKRALEAILAAEPRSFVLGLDIGTYGSAFKTCKGLIDKFGPERIIDTPICESATVGFSIGASQVGGRPIIEYQFADFATESCTQLGLNAGTWYYRSGSPAPILLRLPCGGGLTLGAFHSGEFEGIWSRFPGLKVLYPATPQESYEATLAGFYDPNPCLVMENKFLYWSKTGDIDFDGNVASVWRARRYTEGSDLTIVATGAMVYEALAAAAKAPCSVEVWNPFVMHPLDIGPIVQSVEKTGRLLVVQECGQTAGLGDRVVSLIVQQAHRALRCPPGLLAAPDVPVPFAPELEGHYRPNADKIVARIERMLGEG